jgi:hypothetical protein
MYSLSTTIEHSSQNSNNKTTCLEVSTRTQIHISNVFNSENLQELKQADFQNMLDLKAMAIELDPNCPVKTIPEFMLYMTN